MKYHNKSQSWLITAILTVFIAPLVVLLYSNSPNILNNAITGLQRPEVKENIALNKDILEDNERFRVAQKNSRDTVLGVEFAKDRAQQNTSCDISFIIGIYAGALSILLIFFIHWWLQDSSTFHMKKRHRS